MTERNNQVSALRHNERALRVTIDMRSVAQSRMNVAQGLKQRICSPSEVRPIIPRKTCLLKAFQCFSRYLLFGISLLRRREGRGRSQSPPLRGPEFGGYSSTNLPEKVAPRSSMSEFCSVLCELFLDLLRITESAIWESVKCLIQRFAKTLLSLLSTTTQEGRIQIEEDIRMRSSRVIRQLKRSETLKRTTREAKHGDEAIRADGYMDNSPLRSELITYPQPLKERLAQTDRAISSRVTHKQPPSDLCFAVLPAAACG